MTTTAITTRIAVLYPKPRELARLSAGASAVIEASAGTGKTYLLEHLVLDRIIETDISLENILVVTFTEKATEELTRRLRAAIDRLLAVADGRLAAPEVSGPATAATSVAAPQPASDSCWRLDDVARRRLLRARHSFDRATIATMHGFCQSVLTENPFISQRLFAQQHVDSRQVFGAVFTDVLRRTLSTDAAYRPTLEAWLRLGRSVDDLEQLLYDTRRMACPFGVPFEPARIVAAARGYLAGVADPRLEPALRGRFKGSAAKAVTSRVDTLTTLCRGLADSEDVPSFLQQVDEAVKRCKELFTYLDDKLSQAAPAPEVVSDFARLFFALADAAVPLDVAAASLFTPPVKAQLETHKRRAGLFDFDDMLSLVADSLEGPHGERLTLALRQRYKVALIDEFQDTDPVQWRIFKRIFFDSGGDNPLYIVGDPKQSIYGFRGADVQTYIAARAEVSGGREPAVRLQRNFRSQPAVIDAYNAILDQDASPPFFSGEIGYQHPVVCGLPDRQRGDAGEGAAPAVTLLSVTPTAGTEMRARDIKKALSTRIAEEISALLSATPPVPASEIFVLTRTVAEAEAIGLTLRAAGLPHAFFKQDGLYQTAEARHVRDLLAAVDDPHDRSKRARAWLTPFFGLALEDLPGCAAIGGDHPLYARLLTWKALADQHDYQRLFDRVLDDSGVVRRELFAGSERRLTNYVHLFELLLARTARGRTTLSDLVMGLAAYVDKLRAPAPEEGNIQRRESDREAVQLMTMHKAKGLEADVVFLYGGFTAWHGGRRVRAYTENGARFAQVGRPRRLHLEERLKAEQSEEDQRLLYVALTRARRRLYLPYFGVLSEADETLDPFAQEEEVWRKLHGGYRHVNRRLREIVQSPFDVSRRGLFAVASVPCPPLTGDGADDQDAKDAAVGKVATWLPPPALLRAPAPEVGPSLDSCRRAHAGLTITSYSRLKRAQGGYQAPAALVDALDSALDGPDAAAAPASPSSEVEADRLPGGALTGIFLHAVLEAVPLQTLHGNPSLETWSADPVIRELFSSVMRRTDRDPRHLADAQRLVYAALTTPIALSPTRTLPGIASARAVARETEFLYPADHVDDADRARGFVKGFIDLLFEDEGRVYVVDWKSDILPSWHRDELAVHVANNYALQERLYALALVKMLGITGQRDFDARFGGLIFAFLRGLPDGVVVHRPTYDELLAWSRALKDLPL